MGASAAARQDSARTGGGGGRWLLVVAPFMALLYMAALGFGVYSQLVGGRCGLDIRRTVNGVAITRIESGMPADRVGLRVGDVILSVDGSPAGSPDVEFLSYCTERAGRTLTFEVQRAGASRQVAPDAPVETVGLTTRSPLSWPEELAFLAVSSTVGVLSVAICLAVALARPADPTARILLLAGGTFALGLAVGGWWGIVPGLRTASRNGHLALNLIAAVAVLHLFLAFPAPHPLLVRLRALGPERLRRFGGAAGLLYAPVVVLLVAVRLGLDSVFAGAAAIVALVLAVAALFRSYRCPPDPLARAQLKWVLWALTVCVASLIFETVGPSVSESALLVPSAVVLAPWGLFPLAVGIAVLRYRLFDVDRVLRATIVWPMLTAVLAAMYVAAALAIGEAATTLLGSSADAATGVSLLAALAVAALANPIYRRVQELLDGVIYRSRNALRAFAEEANDVLGRAQPVSVVARFLTDHAAKRLGLSGAWLLLPGAVVPRLPATAGGDPFARLQGLDGPAMLAREALEFGPLPVLAADDPAFAPLYEAGARLLVPLLGERSPGALQSDRPPNAAAAEARVSGRVLAVWVLGLRESGELPDRDDFALLARIARQAAVLLDYARLYDEQVRQVLLQHEVRRAREIQARLLPATLPGWPGRLDLAVRFRPARDVSGDFYDAATIAADGRETGGVAPLQIALGDVVGKGVGSALIMAVTRTALRAVARRPAERLPVPIGGGAPDGRFPTPAAPSPAETLKQASAVLHADIGQGAGGSDFVACALAVVEPASTGVRLRLANAAQVPPLLCRGGEARELVPDGERLPLGVLAEPTYRDLDLVLLPGDVVVFASDGLPEAPYAPRDPAGPSPARRGELFGFARLAECAARAAAAADSAEAVADGVWRAVVDWTGDNLGHDDASLLVLRVSGGPGAGDADDA